MRLKVRNVRPGYCEVWANERDGGRYSRVAYVSRVHGTWHWTATSHFILPGENGAFQGTRRECVADCMRTALLGQAERAIANGRDFSSRHKQCPCRDALRDMRESGLFTINEMHEMHERMEASGDAAHGS